MAKIIKQNGQNQNQLPARKMANFRMWEIFACSLNAHTQKKTQINITLYTAMLSQCDEFIDLNCYVHRLVGSPIFCRNKFRS